MSEISHQEHKDILHLLPAELAWEYRAIPKYFSNNILTLIVDEILLSNINTEELEVIVGFKIKLLPEKAEHIEQLLTTLYRKDHQVKRTESILVENVDDFLNKIILDAKSLKSSDIHIEAYSDLNRIRFRIDGKLLERYRIPKEQYASFINKIKIKAQLDIAEKRLPQDGRIIAYHENTKTDIRVSVLPAMHGEKVVLRLLNNDASHIQLQNLGLSKKQLSDFLNVLKKPHGIILISGPTGSGKTTTLYATLKLINKENTNILTIEDPIEYTLDGINQVQLRENIGLTFSKALRTFLRQDPDVIMLGEIRDSETAQMAIRSALTGHLVLSTIHTNSAWGTIARLIDMGIPEFLLSSTINMTIAQRLVRKLCNNCKKCIHEIPKEFLLEEKITNTIRQNYVPTGCQQCYYTGYCDRIAIYEIIPIDNDLASLIRVKSVGIEDYLSRKNIETLQQNAVELVNQGVTSIEEIYPILY